MFILAFIFTNRKNDLTLSRHSVKGSFINDFRQTFVFVLIKCLHGERTQQQQH